jgi:hypothetical protein
MQTPAQWSPRPARHFLNASLEIDFNCRWTAGPHVGQVRAEVSVAQDHPQSGSAGVEIDRADHTVPAADLDLVLVDHYHSHAIIGPGRVASRFEFPQFFEPSLGIGPLSFPSLGPKPVFHIVAARAAHEFQELPQCVVVPHTLPEKGTALQLFDLRRAHRRPEPLVCQRSSEIVFF